MAPIVISCLQTAMERLNIYELVSKNSKAINLNFFFILDFKVSQSFYLLCAEMRFSIDLKFKMK
jgi:hypothetical protein